MTQSRRFLGEGALALGIILSAAPVFAATPPLPKQCKDYTPTLADCQNPTTFCAQRAREEAQTNANAACNQLINAAAQNAASSLPQRTVRVPPRYDVNGNVIQPETSRATVAFMAEDANQRSMSGLSSFYLGQAHAARTYYPATTSAATWKKVFDGLLRYAWNESGVTVDSCAEYVYEKYYDYSIFEDAAAHGGPDYRAIFNAAYATDDGTGSVPATAIGTRGIANPVQYGKDGTPFSSSIVFPSGAPKNEFFTVPPPKTGKVTISAGSSDQVSILPGTNGGALITLKNLTRNLNLYGTVLPSALLNTIAQGASFYDESWSWHRSMSTRNASVLDETLYEMDRLQEEFASLVARRKELQDSIQASINNRISPVPVAGGQVIVNPGGYDEDEDPIITALYQLEAVDAAIEAALGVAQQNGCLSFPTTGIPVPCDWSPKRFAKRVLNLYQTAREQDFQKCQKYTNDDFAALKSVAMVHGSVNYPAQNYTTSPSRLETYFTRRDQYLKALSATVGSLLDPVSKQPRLKWESGDSYSLGNDMFGATANYLVSVAVDNVAQADCNLAPEAKAQFTATGSVFNVSKELIKANAVINNKRADLDLDVLDNTIPLVDVHQNLVLGKFNLVTGSHSHKATLVDVSTHFVIVAVPVTLGAKLSGVVGLDYSIGGEHTVTTTSQCNVNRLGVSGRIEPYAQVDGEVYAGVDLFIVEVGVKGRIQLVHASVPLEAIAFLNQGGTGLSLQLKGTSHLNFTFMSGRVSAYVEIGIWPLETKFEETLVSWDGLRENVKLFDQSVTAPLVDIRSLL